MLDALRQRNFKPAFAAILSAEHLAIACRDVDLLGVAVRLELNALWCLSGRPTLSVDQIGYQRRQRIVSAFQPVVL